jgi:hypothetical protein
LLLRAFQVEDRSSWIFSAGRLAKGILEKMDFEADDAPTDHGDYKMICEQCGSLTVALPVEASPAPQSILKCGRCGAPRGTLQALRKRSALADLRLRGL